MVGLQKPLHVWCIMHFTREADFAAISQSPHPRSDVHALAEIVEPIIERDGNCRTSMHSDFQEEITLWSLLVETGDFRPHCQYSADRIGRCHKCRHDRIAKGLDDHATMANRHLLQSLEMLLDKRKGV